MSVAEHYDEIPKNSRVVFDWDNTLKIVNKRTKKIECSVQPSFLQKLITEKTCQLYIISAIRPSKMNMDTLLMEVDRLGIRKFFCPFWQSEQQYQLNGPHEGQAPSAVNKKLCTHESHSEVIKGKLDTYVRWGNIIICGYDKAEVFLELLDAEKTHHIKTPIQILQPLALTSKAQITTQQRISLESQVEDAADGLFEDGGKLDTKVDSAQMPETSKVRPVIFFDDEEVNILNFRTIIKDSLCIWIH
ncbi:hypothetical protein RRG08_033921 [Elysia crispata]|uniref:Uncharacterized protein n=1 Tax=Elysia crispata TaxID=231223 RepID=A0AAE1B905_9GAST|nr:hypothetical protein RRG08_033921 [Elysia crispata]